MLPSGSAGRRHVERVFLAARTLPPSRVSSFGTGPEVAAALSWGAEVSGHLVGSTAFKAAGTGDPRPAGSIPVHLRHRVSAPSRRFTNEAFTRRSVPGRAWTFGI